ncbi:MAG TPA: helix-turn-helix domain-containing protein [Rhizomicrobium sp.]|jgi:transcriptional regulator with XRE-family HTH domain
MPKKPTTQFDVLVGRRVSMLRKSAGISQMVLGARLGVTYQQIQKYEAGANRISLDFLFRLSRMFAVPLDHFIEEADVIGDEPNADAGRIASFVKTSEGQQLLRDYLAISSPIARKRVAALMESMAGAPSERIAAE